MKTTSETPLDKMEDPLDDHPMQEKGKSIVHVSRPIVVNPLPGKRIDQGIVAFRYYNSFNYSFLSKENREIFLTIGITSANPREGKTLVASNMAVSLAMAYQKRTVLIDLNLRAPRLHEIFGTPLSPGLSEALDGGSITVTPTMVENLSILPAGIPPGYEVNDGTLMPVNGTAKRAPKDPAVGLEHLSAFRDTLTSLEREFDFVIIDMPSINSRDFPILFAGQLNGLVVVVDSGKTRREDMEKMFRQINERQVLGFVFNRVNDKTL